jgi:hypothetical protein
MFWRYWDRKRAWSLWHGVYNAGLSEGKKAVGDGRLLGGVGAVRKLRRRSVSPRRARVAGVQQRGVIVSRPYNGMSRSALPAMKLERDE